MSTHHGAVAGAPRTPERIAQIDKTYAAAVGRMRRKFDRTPARRGPVAGIELVMRRGRDPQQANICLLYTADAADA
jgi:hypothetical protein